MTVTALEISLNGKVLYTVGMEGWTHLGAQIMGHRTSKEMLEQMMAQMDEVPADFEARDDEGLFLDAHVGVPDSDDSTSSTGQSYGHETLSVGDVVTIRVIKTDSPDLPEPPPPSHKVDVAIEMRRETIEDKK
jgi:hypothetical protein